MLKVVLTGGPSSGKTVIQQALLEALSDRLELVPEAATVLLSGGFPSPGANQLWSQSWQDSFQSAVVALQYSLEEVGEENATRSGAQLILFDRGVLDGAAYMPGGIDEFCRRHNVDLDHAHQRYDVVVHLESLATASPENYGRSNNAHRFESLEQAQRLEYATRAVWEKHPCRHFIHGNRQLDEKVANVVRIVQELL